MSASGRISNTCFSRYWWVAWLFLFALDAQADVVSGLLQYVQQPDPAYRYHFVKSYEGEGFSHHLISMDSQHWRQAGEVNRTLWTHWLVISVPVDLRSDTALLIIAGGNNNGMPPELSSEKFFPAGYISRVTGSIVVTLGQVPNQPLIFPDNDTPLREDGLVSFSWKRALDSGDPGWHAYLPMVKSAVRAMDTAQHYSEEKLTRRIKRFVVTGFSKRGAATWLTAVVDPRVYAISPGVYDVLNFSPSLANHHASYGLYSSAIKDYVSAGIIDRLHTPEGLALQGVVDPYQYLPGLKIPVFIINSAGDEFFPADSAKFYFDELPEDRLIRYIPNTDHSLREPDAGVRGAVASLLAWYQTIILQKQQRPLIRWKQQNIRLTVTTDQVPTAVRLWHATNDAARDFRLEKTGSIWQSESLQINNTGEYHVEVAPPTEGWMAYFLELRFGKGRYPQIYTSRIFITPDRFDH